MSLLLLLGIPLICVGGCLTTLGLTGSAAPSFVSGFGTKLPIGSRTYRRPFDPQSRNRRLKLGLKLCAVGIVLVVVASF